MIDAPPRVFISYAQEAGNLPGWVLQLANRLRGDGIDAHIDQYYPWPEQGWRPWMSEQIARARWVLVICTEEYRQRFDGNAPASVGRGVRWESQHITQRLYDDKFSNHQFVPVLPPSADEAHIPEPLSDYPKFRLNDEYEALYRLVTEQPATPAPELGPLRHLPPLAVPAPPKEGGAWTPTPTATANPYPGLAAFTPDQSGSFFGRESDIESVIAKLEANRFASIVGGSGTGKSSLVAAGVLPELLRQDPETRYLRFKPQSDPLGQLAEAIDPFLPEERHQFGRSRKAALRDALADNPAKAIREHLGADGKPWLVFGDQFEELFTQTDEGRQEGFRAAFGALLSTQGFCTVVTLRREFVNHWWSWLGSKKFAESLVPIDPIKKDGKLRDVIELPAKQAGVEIESELLDELLPEARALAGALPLLALTLHRLFSADSVSGCMTLSTYRDIGGLEGVVKAAVQAIDRDIDADPALSRAAEELFALLASVKEGVATRRSVDSAIIRANPQIGMLLDGLRGIGFVSDPAVGRTELAHDALLVHWPRLARWVASHRDHLALQAQAEHAAREWDLARMDLGSAQHHQWGWERQREALLALLEISQREAQPDPDFCDPGIHAWHALSASLSEPLKSFLEPEPLRLLAELPLDDTPHTRREDIGRRLNQMGDPRRGVGLDADGLPDIVWVNISAGDVTLESDPPESFQVLPFQMARYPVTWKQFLAFVEAKDGFKDPRNWQDICLPPKDPGPSKWAYNNHPAINVSWHDAMAFCAWLTRRLEAKGDSRIRLPTEWEWQWVAQAEPAQHAYPWGKNWIRTRANSKASGIGRPTAVGMYPLGSPVNRKILDLTGNVMEWCLNHHEEPKRIRSTSNENLVLRGGSWGDDEQSCRATDRNHHYHPNSPVPYVGFRVCRVPSIDPLTAVTLDAVSTVRGPLSATQGRNAEHFDPGSSGTTHTQNVLRRTLRRGSVHLRRVFFSLFR